MSQKLERRQENKEDREAEDDTRFTEPSVLSTMNEIFQQLLRNLLLWLLDEEHKPQHLTAVIQEIDEDEGYDSIASKNNSEADKSASKHIRKRRKTRQEDLNIVEGDSKEILIEKFLLLRDAYDELKDDNTNLEYEVESLKDCMGEIEEEMQLQKNELSSTKELLKIFQREKENDKASIIRMQTLIDNFCQEKSQDTQLEMDRINDVDLPEKETDIKRKDK